MVDVKNNIDQCANKIGFLKAKKKDTNIAQVFFYRDNAMKFEV